MVAGDIVSDVFPLSATYYYFQPAVGVEIMVTFVGGRGTATYGGLYDGVTLGYTHLSDAADYNEGQSMKCGINNTVWLVMYANSTWSSFSGIQIK
jgi:hypothetical protein